MNKFNKNQRVSWIVNGVKHFGTLLGAYQNADDTIEYDVLDDSLEGEQEVTVVKESQLKLARKSTKVKYVLKTHILEDIHPKDMSKYVKVKVLK